MGIFSKMIDFILHIDAYIIDIIKNFGVFSYLVIGLIIFIETGLVFVPFIPGDSILFVVGLLSSQGSLNLWLIIAVLILAAIIGDTCNYFIGSFFGDKLLKNANVVKYIGKHIETTKAFFKKYGGIAIIYARFVPIVRTIAPFLAGISDMKYKQFILYNVVGGAVWVVIVTLAGYFLGNLSVVKNNLTFIILLVVFISIVPIIIAIIRSKKKTKTKNI